MTKTKQLHELLTKCEPQFPVIGKEGYGGEQDGLNAVFVGVISAAGGRDDFKERYGHITAPSWLKVHWCEFKRIPGCGTQWELSLAYWPNEKPDNEKVPDEILKAAY